MNERCRGMCSVVLRGHGSGRLIGLSSATVRSQNTTTHFVSYVDQRQKKLLTKSFLLHLIFIVPHINSDSEGGVPGEPLLLSAPR